MAKLYKTVIDGLTNTAVEVELTADEIAEVELREAEALAREEADLAAAQAAADAKAAGLEKLMALGLTEAEAKALAGN